MFRLSLGFLIALFCFTAATVIYLPWSNAKEKAKKYSRFGRLRPAVVLDKHAGAGTYTFKVRLKYEKRVIELFLSEFVNQNVFDSLEPGDGVELFVLPGSYRERDYSFQEPAAYAQRVEKVANKDWKIQYFHTARGFALSGAAFLFLSLTGFIQRRKPRLQKTENKDIPKPEEEDIYVEMDEIPSGKNRNKVKSK